MMNTQIQLMNVEEVVLYMCPFRIHDDDGKVIPSYDTYCCPEVHRNRIITRDEMTITFIGRHRILRRRDMFVCKFMSWDCRCQLSLFTASAIMYAMSEMKQNGSKYVPQAILCTTFSLKVKKALKYAKFVLDVNLREGCNV